MKDFNGIYCYFWETLKDSTFVSDYFYNRTDFKDYLQNPDSKAIDFIKTITSSHNKSAPTIAALSAMDLIEESIGKLRTNHRKHLIHSINVLLLGLCFVEKNPKLKHALLFFPGEKVDINKTHNDKLHLRSSVFHFRWIFACFFHDIGYTFELLAKGLDPDNMGMVWEGNEEVRRGINRIKLGVQRDLKSYIEELRELPMLAFIKDYDNDSYPEYYPERPGRVVVDEKDILQLFTNLLDKSIPNQWGDITKTFQLFCTTFNASFNVGIEKSFDHGKIGAFILLHEIRTHYQIARLPGSTGKNNSWHRANIYYEIMDSALAIYLHNTLRFQLNKEHWGRHSPEKVPPLAYLLTLCDIIVEWDKEQIGYGTNTIALKPEGIHIVHENDQQIKIEYDSKDYAEKVKSIIDGLFDKDFLDIQINHKNHI